VVSGLAMMDEPRKLLAGILSGLDIHYDLGEGHPLLGRRMPDLELVSAEGPLRVFTLLHHAQPVLLEPRTVQTVPTTPTPVETDPGGGGISAPGAGGG
jgi:hypothetical protein